MPYLLNTPAVNTPLTAFKEQSMSPIEWMPAVIVTLEALLFAAHLVVLQVHTGGTP